MFVSETIRVGVVLSAERIRANKITALCDATHIRIRSNARYEILIFTFYICMGFFFISGLKHLLETNLC